MVDKESQCNHKDYNDMFCSKCAIILIQDKVKYFFR